MPKLFTAPTVDALRIEFEKAPEKIPIEVPEVMREKKRKQAAERRWIDLRCEPIIKAAGSRQVPDRWITSLGKPSERGKE